ncbi:hypothetical protein B9Z55_023972 [Caenorhabditis nigoni]|uniref:Uncharacterized protein n=2 Tax=Caenorhabditis nigoni TaxID=1611254 RepID=A0A2G5SSF0_9PELO|nr:hypothetical protein B9Z55_023972 [Caenorhabditis nigoni]
MNREDTQVNGQWCGVSSCCENSLKFRRTKKRERFSMLKLVSEFRAKHRIVTGQDKVLGLFKQHIQDVLNGDEVTVDTKLEILNKWRTVVTPNVSKQLERYGHVQYNNNGTLHSYTPKPIDPSTFPTTGHLQTQSIKNSELSHISICAPLSTGSTALARPTLNSNHMQLSRSNAFCPSHNVPLAKSSLLQSFQQKRHSVSVITPPSYMSNLDYPEHLAGSLFSDKAKLAYVNTLDQAAGEQQIDGYCQEIYAEENGDECMSNTFQPPLKVHGSYSIQEKSISTNFNVASTPKGPTDCDFLSFGYHTDYEWFSKPGTDSSPPTTPRSEAYNPTSSYPNAPTEPYSSRIASLVDQFSPGELGFESLDIEIKANDYQNVSHEYDQDLIVD